MLWKEYPQYAAVKYPRVVKLEDLDISPDAYTVIFDALGEGLGVKLLKGKEVVTAFYKTWDCNKLRQAVTAFRRPFETTKLGDFDPELARALYADLLATVLEKVPPGTPLTIIPDDVLAELPFEALVVKGNARWTDGRWGRFPVGLTYFGDIYPVSYSQSLTVLSLAGGGEKEKTGKMANVLVVADPVFEMTDERAMGLVPAKTPDTKGATTIKLMGELKKEIGKDLKFDRLPQTGKLAQDLAGLFGKTCSVYSGMNAAKSTFFTGVAPTIDQFSYLVFATHGVYSTNIPGIMEPVLAMTMVPPGTDGMLRMTEVMSLKLKADLVALAACETGVGQNISGEGVASMGRAFQSAGARSVLMTLWSDEEKASTTLVSVFFRNLIAGKTKRQALKIARSEIRSEGYEHPFFWASFILVGSGE